MIESEAQSASNISAMDLLPLHEIPSTGDSGDEDFDKIISNPDASSP